MYLGIGIGTTPISVVSESFNPTKISGLKLWLDASAKASLYQTTGGAEATANNDPVGQWRDLSGQNNNFSQSTAAARPLFQTNSINGLPTVKGDGVNDRLLAATSITGSSNFTVFSVMKMRTAAAAEERPYGNVDGSTGKNGFCYIMNAGQYNPSYVVACNNAGTQRPISWVQTYAANTAYVQTYEHGSSLKAYVDNVQKGTASALTMDFQQPFVLFSDGTPTGAFYSSCDFGEVLIYSPALSATDKDRIAAYLKQKWATA